MKTTNNIFNALAGSPGWLNLVQGDKKMSVQLIFDVESVMQALEDNSKTFEEARLRTLQKFVETKKGSNGKVEIVRDEEGGVNWSSDNSEALWNKAFDELSSQEIELDLKPIRISDKDIYGRLGPRDLRVLKKEGIIKVKK